MTNILFKLMEKKSTDTDDYFHRFCFTYCQKRLFLYITAGMFSCFLRLYSLYFIRFLSLEDQVNKLLDDAYRTFYSGLERNCVIEHYPISTDVFYDSNLFDKLTLLYV